MNINNQIINFCSLYLQSDKTTIYRQEFFQVYMFLYFDLILDYVEFNKIIQENINISIKYIGYGWLIIIIIRNECLKITNKFCVFSFNNIAIFNISCYILFNT